MTNNPAHGNSASHGAYTRHAIAVRALSNPMRTNPSAAEGVREALEPLAKTQKHAPGCSTSAVPLAAIERRNGGADNEDRDIWHVRNRKSNQPAAECSRERLMFLIGFQFRRSEVVVGRDNPLIRSSE